MRRIACLIITLIFVLSINANAADLSPWAEEPYDAANRAGLLSLNAVKNDPKAPITREEFCELIMNLYRSATGGHLTDLEVIEWPFDDCDNPAVVLAYALGIVSGKGEAQFDPEGLVTRQELAKMLVNAIKAANIDAFVLTAEMEEQQADFDDLKDVAPWALGEVAVAIKYGLISGIDDRLVGPLGNATREQAVVIIERAYEEFVTDRTSYSVPRWRSVYDGYTATGATTVQWTGTGNADYYEIILKNAADGSAEVITTQQSNITLFSGHPFEDAVYTAVVGATMENGVKVFSEPVEISYRAPLPSELTLAEKELRVFPDGVYFETEEEADANMVEVEVPVWVLKENGTKVASKRYLEVNQFLAEDVIAIFTEIFDDPSQFPIKNVSGYSWRNTAMGKVSQHSYGTCIDINYEENYYCYADGTPITGKYWMPGEDPYSIPEDGIVVKTFAKYGFLWGGNAWGEGSLRDYMHFTYLGK